MVEKFRQAGVFEAGRSYVPRRGDLVVSYDGGLSPSHIGIVTDAAVASVLPVRSALWISKATAPVLCASVRA